jgi:signal transduction histidine kinase/integral membrane sensor domain MASE1
MKWHYLIPLSKTHFWRYFAVVGVLTVAYFGTAKLAFSMLELGVEASPLWPPAGIALAALLLQGQPVWSGVALGAFFFAQSLGVSWTIACGSAFGSALQAVVGAVLLQGMQFRPSLKRLQDVLALVVLGAWVSPLVNATIGTVVGYLGGTVDSRNWGENWWTMWVGDGMGVLVVTPLLLISCDAILGFRLPKKGLKVQSVSNDLFLNGGLNPLYQPWANRRGSLTLRPRVIFGEQRPLVTVECIVCFTLLLAISWLVFGSKMGMGRYPLEYLPFPFVVWAALRFAQLGAIAATLIVSVIAIWGVVQGVGPFVAKAGDLSQEILFLQGFLGVITIMALVVAAAETERALAVDLLKEREASLANAQRLAQLGNWDFVETYQGKSLPQPQLRWSDELYRLFGFAAGAFQPSWEAFFQVVHPADRERVGQAIRGALRENKPYSLDYRIVLPDGSERVVCEQSEIYKGGISGTVQDVTERKHVEAQLRAAAERDGLLGEMALRIRRSLNLDQILNTTVAEVRQFLNADRVFIGQIDRVSDDNRQPEASGKPQERQLSTHLKGVVIAESVDPSYRSLRNLIVDDEVSLQEWRSLFEESRVRVIEDTATLAVALSPQIAAYYSQYQVRALLGVPILLGDEFYGALVVNQCDQPRQWQSWEIDWLTSLATQVAIAIQQAKLYRQITELNTHLEAQVEERTQELSAKMTELQELNQLKDVFLQAVSHDLRTSLLGMSMVFNNLYHSSGEMATLSRPLLERMITSSEHQLDLINSLLEDHFHEERELELHGEPVHLDTLVQDLIAEYSPRLAQNQATLTSRIPGDLPLITADATQLRRVLENLFANALKHNPPGLNLILQITVEDEMIRCTLQDDGVGMSQQQQKSLFKLYIRGLHSQHLTGIGLGLYKCRQIITAHGGQIDVVSAPGAGSTFWFTLPLDVSKGLILNGTGNC